MKVFRVFLIVCITVGLIWVGSRFSVLTQQSTADVFQTYEGPSRGMPDYQEGGRYSSVGHTIVNGQQFSYAVEVVDASISDVIDFYRKRYAPTVIRMIPDKDMVKLGIKPGDPAHRIIQSFERMIAESGAPVFSKVGDSYGFLGVLDKGDNSKWFVKNGSLSESVVGKAVVALKEDPNSTKTTVIRYWTEGPFKLATIFPKAGEDAPGQDLDNVDRHPYSQRLFSISQYDKWGMSVTLIYYVDDTIDNTVLYYATDLRSNGWEIPSSAVKGAARAGYSNTIFAKRGVRELTMLFGRDENGTTMVTMLERLQR